METKEIVKYETPQGEVVLTPEIVRKYLVSGSVPVSDQEIKMFLSLCIYQKLNPFLREVYLIKYKEGQPAAMVTGKETFLKRAVRNPKYAGHKTGITANDAGDVVSAWAEVYVSGYQSPIRCEVDFEEYCQYAYNYETKQKKPNRFWSEKPKTMLKKVALVQALREAFPEDFGGLYSQEEMPIGERLLPTEPVTIDQIPEPKPKVPQIAPINDLEPKTPTNTLPDTQDMQPKEAEGQEANKKHLAKNNKDIARGIIKTLPAPPEPKGKEEGEQKGVNTRVTEVGKSNYEKFIEAMKKQRERVGDKIYYDVLADFQYLHANQITIREKQERIYRILEKVVPDELHTAHLVPSGTSKEKIDEYAKRLEDVPKELEETQEDKLSEVAVDALMDIVGTLDKTQMGLVRSKLLMDYGSKLNSEMTIDLMFWELTKEEGKTVLDYMLITLLKRGEAK